MSDEIATRVIHHLDQAGRVVKVEWESAAAVGARKVCVVQTHELIRRANELVFCLEHMREQKPYIQDRIREAGYDQATEQIRYSEELQALKTAIANLRPYLAIMSRAAQQGMLFPEPQAMPGLPDIPQQRKQA